MNANAIDVTASTKAKRNTQESRNQIIPSETHLVSQVAPIVATIMFFTMFNIGSEKTRAAKIGRITAIVKYKSLRNHTARDFVALKI